MITFRMQIVVILC